MYQNHKNRRLHSEKVNKKKRRGGNHTLFGRRRLNKVLHAPILIFVGSHFIKDIDVDETNRRIYWTDHVNTSISAANLDGSAETIIIDTNTSLPTYISVDGANGYVSFHVNICVNCVFTKFANEFLTEQYTRANFGFFNVPYEANFCKSSHSRPPCWFPFPIVLFGKNNKMIKDFLFRLYYNTKLQPSDKNINTHLSEI